MKKIRITIILIMFLSLSAFNNKPKSMTAFDFMSRFNPTFAKQMPVKEKKIEISRIFAKGNTLSFDYAGVNLRFDFIGEKENFIELNGVSFSKKEATQKDLLRKLIVTRFGLKLKNNTASLINDGRNFASETTVSPLGEESFQPTPAPTTYANTATGGQVQQTATPERESYGGVNFNGAFESTEVCLFCDAAQASNNTIQSRRQRMQLAYDMITGDEQAGMLNFVGGWMGGLNTMLAQSTPMDAFMSPGGQSPSSIEMPRHY